MKITTDKEASVAIQQLCDIALKAAGIKIYKLVTEVLSSIKEEEVLSDTTKKK